MSQWLLHSSPEASLLGADGGTLLVEGGDVGSRVAEQGFLQENLAHLESGVVLVEEERSTPRGILVLTVTLSK